MSFPTRARLAAALQSDYLLLALIALPAALPLLLHPGLPNTADGVLHLYRTFELDRAWRDGVFYPRIAADFAYGYGYPIFNYYAPLFYFLSQFLHLTGVSLEWAVKGAIVLGFYAYPLGMYWFARDWVGRGAALAAGAAYLYAPYRFYEAFIQGDYPQFLALALVPFCLWAVTGNRQPATADWGPGSGIGHKEGDGRGMRFSVFVAAYSALVLSHNITALIATPFIGAYMLLVLALSSRGNRERASRTGVPWGRIGEMAAATALAVGATAFFWLPALGEQSYVRIEKLTHGFFDFRNYFLTPGELLAPNVPPDLAGVNPYIPFNLGPAVVILALLGGVLATVRALGGRARFRAVGETKATVDRRPAPQRLGSLLTVHCFFALAALAAAAMSLPLSTALWQNVPLLPLTEFPWRFVGIAAVPLAVLAGLAVHHAQALLPPRLARWLPALAALALALDSAVYLFPRTPYLIYGDPTLADLARFELASGALGTTSAGEYLPQWTARRMYDSPLTPQLLRNAKPDHLRREALPVTVRVAVEAQTVNRSAYRIETVGALTIREQRIFFPGWRATIDGQRVPLELVAPTGVMQVEVPEGKHLVEFAFGETPLRTLAFGITLAALGGAGAAAWLRRRVFVGSWNSAVDGATTNGATPASPEPPPTEVIFGRRFPFAAAALAFIAFTFVAPRIGFVRISQLPDVVGMQTKRGDLFGARMRLLGYDLSSPGVTAGETLALTLYWQPVQAIAQEYAVFAHLDNPLTLETVAQTWNERPGNISTLELPLSLYVRDPHVMRLPEDLEPGVYWLRVGMLDPRSGQALTAADASGTLRTRLLLQTVRVRRNAPPDLSRIHKAGARFGAIELLGYTLEDGALALYWRAPQTPERDATVFVHLLGADDKPLATLDGPPAGGLLPVSAWEPGEIVVDRRVLSAIPPGARRVAVGLYDPQTAVRYPARDGNGAPLASDQLAIELAR